MKPLATAALAAWLAIAASARADVPTTTVVLLEPEAPTAAARETLTRAKGELAQAGFRVVISGKHGVDTRAALESAMAESGAVAAIAIEPTQGTTIVEVWVSDRLTKKLSIRPVETAGQGDTPVLLAIRAVELLRASLIELRDPGPRAEAVASVPPAVQRLTAPPDSDRSTVSFRSGFGIEAGGTGLLYVSPTTPAIAPMLGLSYGTDFGLGVRVRFAGPTAGPGLEGTLGVARVTEELLLAELVFAPPLDAPVCLLATAGLGFLHVDASGTLSDPRRERSGGSTVFAATVGAGIDFLLDDQFGIGLETFVGVAAPGVVIDMGREEVGVLGQPVLGLSAGVVGVL